MDEDLRNRYRVPRRDYTTPPQRPIQSQPKPTIIPPPRPDYASHKPAVQHRRPVHHQPAAARPEPQAPQPAVHHPVRPKKRKWSKVILIMMFLTVVGLAGGLWAYPKYANPNPFTASIQTSAKFALFYPKKLPPGYTVDKSSIKMANNTLTYYANKGGTRIVFTSQSVQPSLDFSAFYKAQLKGIQHYSTPYGQAVIGLNDNRQLGSLVSGNTWLLLSTNSPDVSAGDMSLVLKNLKKY